MRFTKKTWYIAHNGLDVVHYGDIEVGDVVTGQPMFETFDNEPEWRDRLKDLGVEPEE